MNEYEQLTNDCKIIWKESFNLTTEKYTQVSGYIFNENNQLLIVRNDNTWTIPGGHPENDEASVQTLIREVMEEAYVTIKDIIYLGAVEVVENGELYYQLRYIARIDKIKQFKAEWEINKRKFVNLKDLHKYIAWSEGITFKAQIDSAKKYL